LRGAFLATGTVARPDAAAHLEILCRDSDAAALLASSLEDLGIPGLVLSRRGRALVAARTVESVAAALSSMGAQHGRLRFEEGRVLREVRASVNRRLNAETANLRRTVTAGVRQLAAITALEADPSRFELLPAALREAAALRLRHPQDTLDALAERAGCSRSAMADRLRRLLVEAAPGGSLAAGSG
jgi:DNA-binding protein WhiA